MNEHKHYETEYGEAHDTGTYMTGSVNTPGRGGVALAIVLTVIVFLLGFCSALGLVNVRMLHDLMAHQGSTMPVDKGTLPTATESPLYTSEDPVPSVPAQAVQMQLSQPPHYFSQFKDVEDLTEQQIYEKNAQSLVQVYCLTHFNSTLTGIGVVLTSDGFLLTNAHLVDSSSRVLVELHDGSLLRAAVVGIDPFTDVAVLYVPRTDLVPAQFCMTKNLQVTEPTYAIESLKTGSQGPSICVSGVFSVGRMLSISQNSLSLVQTFQGTDCGPVFNSQGQIIGLQAGKISNFFHPDDTKGLGLIVPSDEISQVVMHLTSQGQIPGRPDLGLEVETISALYQNYWNLPSGLMITYVYPGSTAQQQGLRPGDILIALDGQRITSREDLYQMLYSQEMGKEVIAVIYRQNVKFTVVLTIDERLIAMNE